MARRRSYYGTRKRTSPRKYLLYIAVIAVVAIAGKKLYDMSFGNSEPTVAELEIITPEHKAETVRTKPVVKSTPVAVKQEPKQAEPVASKPEPQVTQPQQTIVLEPEPEKKPTYHPQFTVAMDLYQKGLQAMDSNDVLKARELLSDAVGEGLPLETEKQARNKLNDLAEKWLFSKNIYENDPYCQRYKVQSGDYLTSIGNNFDIPYQFIMRVNHISRPENLRAGENIKVVKGPFLAVADRTKFILTLYLDDVIAYTWPISTGKEGRSTPTGKWLVTKGKKLMNPEWTDPDTGSTFLPDDPENPLGERWIGIHGIDGDAIGRTGFGIHGTIEPHKIGQPASRGCIRLRNQDVEVVYDMLMEGKSTVVIKD